MIKLVFEQIAFSHLLELLLFLRSDRLFRTSEPVAVTSFDFDEHQFSAFEGDEIDLSTVEPVVPLQNPVSLLLQQRGCELIVDDVVGAGAAATDL